MIQLPEEPKILSEERNKASFEISPLYPGYGISISNALRRVLLSSLSGATITSVQIQGAPHEFTALPNVRESVIDIILNLKAIRFKFHGTEPATLTIAAKGEGEVRAKDIKITSDVEVINDDQLIATLTDKKAELNIEFVVEKGMGYVPVEQRQKEKVPIGTIALDANFNPVQSVNFKMENIRVGQRTDYNKLFLEITTDGSITPHEALVRASEILIDHFNIVKMVKIPQAVAKEEKKAKKTVKAKKAKKTTT
jgi:DNA-directed RNA polymerase subunit alpha